MQIKIPKCSVPPTYVQYSSIDEHGGEVVNEMMKSEMHRNCYWSFNLSTIAIGHLTSFKIQNRHLQKYLLKMFIHDHMFSYFTWNIVCIIRSIVIKCGMQIKARFEIIQENVHLNILCILSKRLCKNLNLTSSRSGIKS